jgi:hypothetical protein
VTELLNNGTSNAKQDSKISSSALNQTEKKPFKLQSFQPVIIQDESFQPLQSDWKNKLFKLQALELSSSAINQTEKQTFEIQSFQALQEWKPIEEITVTDVVVVDD